MLPVHKLLVTKQENHRVSDLH